LAGYGMKQAGEEVGQMNSLVNSAVKTGNFNALLQDPNTSDVGWALQVGDLQQQRALELQSAQGTAQTQRALMEKGLMLDPKTNTVAAIPGYGQAVSEIERAKLPPMPTAMPDTGASLGPDLGVPGLDQVEAQLYRQQIAEGKPATQAAVSARETVSNMRKQAKDIYGKQMGEEANTIAQMEEIIRKGQEGMQTAGNTGSSLASGYEKLVATLAPILPGSQEEAQRQAAGDALLDQTKQLGATMNRIVGSGAMSDFETKALMKTAMGSDKPNATNEAIFKQYQIGLGVVKEHNDFMNYFMEKTGSNPERAQTLWELYKRANPIVTEDGQLNSNRTPWQKFDFTGAYGNFMSGGQPQAPQGGGQVTPADRAKIEALKAQLRGGR